jgi:hypothetical protein
MRKGRMDEIFAVTFPSESERMEILKIHLKKRGHTLSPAELRAVAQYMHNYVGSEIEAVVKDALIDAFNDDQEKITVQDLIKQAEKVIPLATAHADKVKFMNEWAKNNARPASRGMNFETPVAAPKEGGDKTRFPVIKRGHRSKIKSRIARNASEN